MFSGLRFFQEHDPIRDYCHLISLNHRNSARIGVVQILSVLKDIPHLELQFADMPDTNDDTIAANFMNTGK